MDIYRKELNQIYASQHLEAECLPASVVTDEVARAATLADVTGGSVVVTDAACDRCYIFGGRLGPLMGFFDAPGARCEESSSDEDRIYTRIHPEDLVDKRLLEYEFFRFVNICPVADKLHYRATCRIRMRDASGTYRYVDNTTSLLSLSPAGKIWLILCTYDLSTDCVPASGISPAILDTATGRLSPLSFGSVRERILSSREKQILALIRDGLPSKLIADRLQISIHTVNRHRQNIIAKLSVTNSIEAIKAAAAMKLL